VDGAALHQHVAGLEVHALAVVELHVDLARYHHRVVDRVGAVVARRHAGAEAHHAEHRAIGERGADLAARRIGVAVVVDREALARPDHGGIRARPGLRHVLGGLVDRHDRAAVLVVPGDDAADGEAHRWSPWMFGGAGRIIRRA
jgi:hypothetical protein